MTQELKFKSKDELSDAQLDLVAGGVVEVHQNGKDYIVVCSAEPADKVTINCTKAGVDVGCVNCQYGYLAS